MPTRFAAARSVPELASPDSSNAHRTHASHRGGRALTP
jgi:hypothetical protein